MAGSARCRGDGVAAPVPAPPKAARDSLPLTRPRRFQLPRSRRRYRFSMMAMADMMFQLLVFFMLSARLVPYSTLDLTSGRLAGPGPGAAGSQPDAGREAADPRVTAVWTLQPDGTIVANGQSFAPARLPALADALEAQQTRNLLLVVRAEAEVQGVVTVLEALARRGITGVQIAPGGTVR